MNAPIVNYSCNQLRRADLSVSISYESDLALAVDSLITHMKSIEKIVESPAPIVVVSKYADSGIDLSIRFWTKNEDYWNVYFAMNAAIKRIFDEKHIVIPYPQRVITLNHKDVNYIV
jgi:small conductance mechanosensitive channel